MPKPNRPSKPYEVVRRVASEQGVTPEQMLCYLLGTLQNDAVLRSATSHAASQPTLLSAIDEFAKQSLMVDSLNAKEAVKSGVDPENAQLKSLQAVVKTGMAVQAVLKQIVNETENYGLDRAVKFDAMLTEFIGGAIDGQKRLITNSVPKIGDEVEIRETSDSEYVAIYQLREDNKCYYLRREHKPKPTK